MKSRGPVVKDLVLVGGGHSHVAVLKMFAMKPLAGVRITLITREVHTPYSGMLPGYIAGHYALDDCHIDLRPLAQLAGARLYHDSAVRIDLAGKRVICAARPPVGYDVVSIDIGSSPRTDLVPGAAEHVVPVKPIGRFVERWHDVADRLLERSGKLRIALVGAGAGGTELTLSIQHRLGRDMAEKGLAGDRFEFHLFTDMAEVMTTHNARVRRKFARILAERGVTVHTDTRVVRVAEGRIESESGETFEVDEVLWVTQAGAQSWPGNSGLDVDDDGFIRVDDTLRSLSHPDVFAAGDIAHVVGHPRPKAGVFAVCQGPPLHRNLRRILLGKQPKPFTPPHRFLSLVSTGDAYAVASRGPIALEGRWVWAVKDWIDRRWMRKYIDLPEMDEDDEVAISRGLAGPEAMKEISAIAMRCGGCGAKVGATVLGRVMNELEPVERADVLVGLKAPDDAAVVDVPPGKVMVLTVDYFRSFIDDPYVFGQIAANHALGDIFAMGAEPQSALAVVTVPYGLEAKVEADLREIMAGAMKVLADNDTALVGGHTSEGAELALGFSAGRRDRHHQADRHRHTVRRRHAPEGQGAVDRRGARLDDSVQPGRRRVSVPPRRHFVHRRDRLRRARPSGRDDPPVGRRRRPVARSGAAVGRRARLRARRRVLLAPAAERPPATCHPQPGRGVGERALLAGVRSADRGRLARQRPRRGGCAMRRRAPRVGLRRHRDHRRGQATVGRARADPASRWGAAAVRGAGGGIGGRRGLLGRRGLARHRQTQRFARLVRARHVVAQ